MVINLTPEQINQLKLPMLRELKTEELLGEIITRFAMSGDLEKVNILSQIQKEIE